MLCDGQRPAEIVELFVLNCFVHLLQTLLSSLSLLLQMLLQDKILVTKLCWLVPLGNKALPSVMLSAALRCCSQYLVIISMVAQL